jgi:SET domain-containing protein
MAAASDSRREPMFEVRNSKVHGLGVFATRRIRKGTRIVEYLGERVSHAEADRRYESKDANDNHTFLFIVDRKTVIDAGVDGNDARYFNHSCDPNCESVVENRRVFIEATRTIEPGEEMTYDYQIQREKEDPPNIDEIFACRCGFAKCRGTMLWPDKKPETKRKATGKAGAKTKTKTKTKTQTKAKTKASNKARKKVKTRRKSA